MQECRSAQRQVCEYYPVFTCNKKWRRCSNAKNKEGWLKSEFGHGPHVMRGMEFYKGRLIAYSLGNFCGYGVLSTTGFLGVSGVLKVNLNKDGSWASGQLVPTEMTKSGLPVP